MLFSAAVLALAASPAMGAYVGFNYGATFTNGAVKVQSDYEAEFKAAQALISAPQTFSSARLFTMIQGGTDNSVNEAIPAAISTKTSLLLGLWASAGDASFANELAALKSTIATYGSSLGSGLDIAGISIGSEDLYRVSPTGVANDEYAGASPDTIVNYIGQVRDAIANTPFANIPLGHVDTWTAWVNASNSAVAAACDWVGVDAYPYFQDTVPNSISNGAPLFTSAVDQTKAAVGDKPVWITETGWPVSGPTRGQAVPSADNAKTYWDDVGCPLFGSTNTWWFTFQDAAPTTPSPSFGLVGSTLSSNPLYDLSCSNVSSPTSSSAPTASAAATSVGSGNGAGILPNATMTGVSSSPTGASGSGSSGSGSGSSGSGPGGAGSGTGTGTGTSTGSRPSSSYVTASTGAANLVSAVAAFAALLAAASMVL